MFYIDGGGKVSRYKVYICYLMILKIVKIIKYEDKYVQVLV